MRNIGLGRLVATFAGLVAAVALIGANAPTGEVAADSCSAISPRSLTVYGGTIGTAHKWANEDAAKNGTRGEYAVAARNSRDQLKRAQDRAAEAAADLGADPRVTTPAEAGTVKEHLRFILELVPQAAHWAMISEIYHDSPDAREAFEGSVEVLREGNRLFAEAGRCYMEL